MTEPSHHNLPVAGLPVVTPAWHDDLSCDNVEPGDPASPPSWQLPAPRRSLDDDTVED